MQNIIKILGKKEWINEIDPFAWFQWYFRYLLARRPLDDERHIYGRKLRVDLGEN